LNIASFYDKEDPTGVAQTKTWRKFANSSRKTDQVPLRSSLEALACRMEHASEFMLWLLAVFLHCSPTNISKNLYWMELGTAEVPLEGHLPKGTEEKREKSQDVGCSVRHLNWAPFECTAQTLPDGRTFWVPRILKADSHITCRAHAVSLSCRAAKGL
jgi:hypothetical protein